MAFDPQVTAARRAAIEADLNRASEKHLRSQGIELGPKTNVLTAISSIASLALFIIACVGAAGAFPGSAMGWTTIALVGVFCSASLAMGDPRKRKVSVAFALVSSATIITLGALGAAGVLSGTQVGWGIIGSCIVSTPLSCCIGGTGSLLGKQVRIYMKHTMRPL